MKVKRFLIRIIKVVLTLFLILFAIGVITNIIYDNIIGTDEISIQESYEIKKEKCELLRKIASDLIEEGKGINTKGITNINKDIKYKIYNDGYDIIFYYYIEEPNSSKHTYNALITLSNDYKILSEEYSVEVEDYETFKHTIQFTEKVISAMYALFIVAIIVLIILGVYFVVKWWRKRKVKPKINS